MRRLLSALALLAIAGGVVAVVRTSGSSGQPAPTQPRRPVVAKPRPAVQELTYRSAGRTLGITLRNVPKPRALIVFVHGGGFRSGNRQQMDDWSKLFAADGYDTATSDYRLASPSDHDRARMLERAAADALAALNRLQRDGALRKLPVVLWGYSAGALTVLRVGVDHPRRVKALVSLAGYGDPNRLKAGDPPMLLFNGTADRAEPISRANETCRAARAVGVTCRQVVYRGVTHALPVTRGPQVHRTARAWLAQQVK
jgi:pimeloyl-ACP methyl ester carboxylesterase